MGLLETTIGKIEDIDRNTMEMARRRQNQLTKPLGSLGVLEELSVRIAGIEASPNPKASSGVVFVMAGDHGVCEEGVSAFPQEVTMQMLLNFMAGGAAINVLASHAGARVVVTDVGVRGELGADLPIYKKKVAHGTKNMARGPAMTRQEAIRSVEVGIEVFETEYTKQPFDIAGTGDMGIGNTTPSTAIASILTGRSVVDLAGRGTGIDDAGLMRKISTIGKAIALNSPDPLDGLDVLSKVGGFEIGAIAGVILAAASRRVPVLVDGYISGAAALIARSLCPKSVQYMIASHLSADSGHAYMLSSLGLRPIVDFDMRLGEGTGSAIAMTICDAACRVLNEMATFSSAGVSEKI
jgi:nicotinate-nucleotide--dimethylbenzimidazole phosphoribosyltransferase